MALSRDEQERDAFFKEWQLKELMFQHLVAKAAYTVQDHAIVWSRIATIFTGWLALFGGCIWLHTAALQALHRWSAVVLIPLVACDVHLFYSLLKVVKAAGPAYQIEAHAFPKLVAAWKASREKHRELRRFSQDCTIDTSGVEWGLILATWHGVSESAAIQNKDRFECVNSSFRLLVKSIGLFVVAVILWWLMGAFYPERNAMADPNPKDSPADDIEIVHPATEVTEKSEPTTGAVKR